MVKKKTETVVVTWRVKEALRRRLEAAALHNEVSVNNEITRRIEESFTRAEVAGLTENVDRLSKVLKVAEWLLVPGLPLGRLLRERLQAANEEPELPMPHEPPVDLLLAPSGRAETNEERQARLRAAADKLLKIAERSEARSANDLGVEPREWDTRNVPRKTDERRQARLRERQKGSKP